MRGKNRYNQAKASCDHEQIGGGCVRRVFSSSVRAGGLNRPVENTSTDNGLEKEQLVEVFMLHSARELSTTE